MSKISLADCTEIAIKIMEFVEGIRTEENATMITTAFGIILATGAQEHGISCVEYINRLHQLYHDVESTEHAETKEKAN